MNDLPDYIFGIGPGRCGTKSLAALLSACDGIEAQHEGAHIPWGDVDPAVLKEQTRRPMVAVGYQWLWAAIRTLRDNENVRVVGLLRPSDEFTRSAVNKLNPRLVTYEGKREEMRFPTYIKSTVVEAWQQYWVDYSAEMCNLYAQYPDSVTLLPTDALNEPQRVLDACGVPRDRQTSQTFHLNRRLHA